MRFCLLLLTLALAGCSTTGVVNTAPEKIAVVPESLKQNGSGVSVVQIPNDGSSVIGKIEAFACQKYTYEPQPTNELAIAMLKSEAASRGATAITKVELSKSNVDFVRNCFTTIKATAIALK